MTHRSLAAALVLTALLSPARSDAQGPAARIIVYECYTASDVAVAIDGRPLALIPRAERNDSIGVCYQGTARLGARVRVRVRSGDRQRQVDLRPGANARFLHITPAHAPYAWFAPAAPVLD